MKPMTLLLTLSLALNAGSLCAQAYPPYGYAPNYGPGYGSGQDFAPRYAPSREPDWNLQGGFRATRRMDVENYYIDVRTYGGLKPSAIKFWSEGNWLVLSSDRSEQQKADQSLAQGRGFQRQYTYSSSVATQRFLLPMDADLRGVKKEVKEEEMLISIPRRR